MHHDSQMYRLPYVPTVKATDVTKPPSTWMQPMSELRASSIVEIPANWHLDDWPAFNVGNGGNGYIDPNLIFKMWTEQFDFYYQEYDSFVFPITIHPQVSGKPHVLRMHERLLKHINSYEGVEWMTMVEMSNLYKSGQIPGHVVEGVRAFDGGQNQGGCPWTSAGKPRAEADRPGNGPGFGPILAQ
ncbi:unnamed protein product [Penicillium olsonii]|nr:unnamed protein product [Penicillium olsonii]